MESIKQTVAKGEGETPLNDPLAELYQSFNDTIAANPEMTFDEMRRVIDHCADVAEEPRGVDYIEDSFAGSQAMWLLPKTLKSNLTLLCLHGGGYVVGSMYSHRKMFGHFAKRLGARALVLDYRLAPENPHPGPVNEASRAYRWLLEDNKLNSADIAFIGDSGRRLVGDHHHAARARGRASAAVRGNLPLALVRSRRRGRIIRRLPAASTRSCPKSRSVKWRASSLVRTVTFVTRSFARSISIASAGSRRSCCR